MKTNFLLGSLAMTNEARAALKRIPFDLIARHAINEHGLLSEAERQRNEVGMLTRGAIRSRYRADPTNLASGFVLIETGPAWDKTLVSLQRGWRPS